MHPIIPDCFFIDRIFIYFECSNVIKMNKKVGGGGHNSTERLQI